MELTAACRVLEAWTRGLPEVPGTIRLENAGPTVRIVIDNPSARGAFTMRMMWELAEIVRELQVSADRAVLLVSTDPVAFCAGGHLGQVRRAVTDPEKARTMARAMTAVLDGLLDLPVPSVAALSGLAVGGGAELVTACDLRVLGPDARIHFVHGKLGIAPGWGGTGRLVRLLGRRQALKVLLDARPIGAEEALALGLADRVSDDPSSAALEMLAGWGHVPEALRALKRQVVAAEQGRPAEDVEAFASVWGGPAHEAALARLRRHTG